MVATYEEEIKNDDDYNDEFHPLVDRIYNTGRLTLIYKTFIYWEIFFTCMINQFINEEIILSEREKVIEYCYSGLDGNEPVFLKFKLTCENINGVTEDITKNIIAL